MSEKVGAIGGTKGGVFDDGVFDGVKNIIVGKDFRTVTYIKIEYEKDGKYEIREHRTNRGQLEEFSVDYPSEYIIAICGSYDNIFVYGSTLIKSLLFKTSYGRISPILGHTTLLGNPAGKEFMLEGKNGGKLLGFHGRSGQALDAIGAHFTVVDSSLKTFKLQGGNGGFAWDDGAFDGVRKVLIGRNGKNVGYVRFEYAKGQITVPHAHGNKQEAPQEFLVDYPNEHITSVEGTIDGYLTSLTFKTSKGRTSPAFGTVVGSKFLFEETGLKLVGFYGRSGNVIDALGAHFAPLPTTPAPAPIPVPAPTPIGSTGGTGSHTGGSRLDTCSDGTQKMEAQGGKGGNQWDDGSDHDDVTKIYVAAGGLGIENIKFDYIKSGERKGGIFHGVKASRAIVSTIGIGHPKEYLVSVEGWYDSSNIIQGIKFQTNNNTSVFIGYEFSGDGTQFSLQVKDKKIICFHGFVGSHLNSLGAYFAPTSSSSSSLTPTPNKLEAQGGNGGETFDDGAFDNVRKVYVGQGDSGVAYIKFEYETNGKRETREHGKITLLGTEEFEVDSDDYITSVEFYYEKVFGTPTDIITSLILKTFKGITSQPFGMVSGNKSILEGGKIAGFHGRASNVIHSLGAYISPSMTSSTPATPKSFKLPAQGGNGGVSWDDGAHDHVRKVYVGQGDSGVAF
ncbi:PREDICTED: myrosinase-binding protein 2-like isoform X1 [Camelina sativa]|uniref:Myrosinase-binding protein 2-like isoform X1 n=2 Tax=Camelina sativa TaxID=90675 RepID=A0ABM1QVH8_CAMSA|nr:PREDICTED: myrosinase-binding protein 2-like isoform X1 [Camelina sativa]XP_019090766.1 PREDICTED: myrosinase-binding protein 2-like isoform X1 [Camelina sativa]